MSHPLDRLIEAMDRMIKAFEDFNKYNGRQKALLPCYEINTKKQNDTDTNDGEDGEIKMLTEQTLNEMDNYLRKEGYVNAHFAIANMIENFAPRLSKLSGAECCAVLLDTIREIAKQRSAELEKEFAELKEKIEREEKE